MNRAVALALLITCLPLAAVAQVQEPVEDKAARVEIFQDRRLIYEIDKKTLEYSLRQGPDPIYDVDFVTLINEPSLTRDWLAQRNKDYAIWIGSGAVGLPVGTLLFLQNFRAEGPLAFFANSAASRDAAASDVRTYTLSVVGVAIAMYGAYSLGLWLLETLDLRHPNRLEDTSLAPRVREFNETLRERLNLDLGDIPSPPPPRPSPSPSPTQDPDDMFSPPSPGVRTNQDLPMDSPPPAIPMPLPVITPGTVPSQPVTSPAPRPSEFRFPGAPGRVKGPLASPDPNLAPGGTPVSSPVPKPSASSAP